MVLQSYNNNNKNLAAPMRDKLIKDIVNHYIENNVFMHDWDYQSISNSICETFESEHKTLYYCRMGKYPSGRLFNTYKNSSARLRKAGLFPSKKKAKKRLLEETFVPRN